MPAIAVASPFSVDSFLSSLLVFTHTDCNFPFKNRTHLLKSKHPPPSFDFLPTWRRSHLKRRTCNYCSNSNSTPSLLDNDDDDDVLFDEGSGSESQLLSEDGVCIEIKKLGRNSRRIRSKIEIDASLDTVWDILTDYEKLAEFVPNLAVSQVVEKKDNFVRLYQIGQQNLALGIKFNAKGVLDCYEKELEVFSSGKKREIDFKMIEGDFQLFEGKWSIQQLNRGKCEDHESSLSQNICTTLSYSVDVRPKMWLPVRLVEGRLCNEIKSNLSCIREAAKKLINNEGLPATS